MKSNEQKRPEEPAKTRFSERIPESQGDTADQADSQIQAVIDEQIYQARKANKNVESEEEDDV